MPRLNEFIGENNSSQATKKLYLMSFAVGSVPQEIKMMPEKVNFSENPKAAVLEYQLENFSLLELIRMSKLQPKVILDKRVKEVVRYVNSANPSKIQENRFIINNYLNQFIFENIMKLMSNPEITQINIGFLLGLQRYVSNLKAIRDLQRTLIRVKKVQETSGFINKTYQGEIKDNYDKLWDAFIEGIENKYIEKSKRGILSGNALINQEPVSEDKSEIEVAAFSENSNYDKLSEILIEHEGIDHNPDVRKIKEIKLSDSDKEYLKEYPLFDDKELTDLVIEGTDESISKALKRVTEFNKKFSEETDFQTQDKYIDDQLARTFELNNFSLKEDIPVYVEWNADKTIGFYGINDPTYWYRIEIDESGDKVRVNFKKFPGIINFRLDSYTKDKQDELLSNSKYDYINKEFDNRGEADKYIKDALHDIANPIFDNFSVNLNKESATPDEESKTISWIDDSDNIIIGYKEFPTYWYNFIAYKTDSGRFILEIRELLKEKYDSIKKINIEELASMDASVTKEFNSELELKSYCDNLEIINE